MKRVVIVSILCLVTIASLCGCTEKPEDGGANTGYKTVTMSAQELLEDRRYYTSVSGGVWTSKVDYKSLEKGDTLIIIDEISDIKPNSDGTTITFDVNYTFSSSNATFTELDFIFEGDLTNTYTLGDTVEILLTVDHTTYTNETKGMSTDMEVFKEGWNQTYFENLINSFFNTNLNYQIFPSIVIRKITEL